jgi:SAM-dependent methyltransferase
MHDDSSVAAQREYYSRTADSYNAEHVSQVDEHSVGLAWMAALIEQRQLTSVLDVGSGTGRALLYLKGRTTVTMRGIEPSPELRDVGHRQGLSGEELTAGDALALQFPDNSFDLVCAFAVLHHVKDHRRVVSEMCRVARKAIFISDANNLGQGSRPIRAVKQGLKAFGLWRFIDLVRTGFKGYHYSEGDGVFYSYSIFDDVPIIKAKFPDLMYMSTRPSGANLYRTAETVALFASI